MNIKSRSSGGVATPTVPEVPTGAGEVLPGDIDRGAPLPERGQRIRRRALTLLLQIAFVFAFLLVWQLLTNSGVLTKVYSSDPISAAQALIGQLESASFLNALGYTLYEALVGFALSAVGGVVLGLLLFELDWLYVAARPFITLFNNIPRLVFAPLIVLYVGIGPDSRILLVTSISLIIVLLNTVGGLQNSNPDHLLLARSLGASRLETFVKFRLAGALPTIFVGFQLAMTFAFTGAVVGEMLTGGDGLGALVAQYTATYSMDKVVADIFVMGLLATVLAALMRLVERRLLRWRRFEFGGK